MMHKNAYYIFIWFPMLCFPSVIFFSYFKQSEVFQIYQVVFTILYLMILYGLYPYACQPDFNLVLDIRLALLQSHGWIINGS